jgi:hypothetical protein
MAAPAIAAPHPAGAFGSPNDELCGGSWGVTAG